MNNGYIGHSISKRGQRAYDNGLLTKGKIKKEHLEQKGITLPVNFIKYLMPDIIVPTEWHHTSKHFNESNFYDMEDIKEQIDNLDIPMYYRKYQEDKSPQKTKRTGYFAYIEYGEWSGSRKHPKLEFYKDYAYITHTWAYLSANKKKKIDGNHFKILTTYKIKPRKMSTEKKQSIFKKLYNKK